MFCTLDVTTVHWKNCPISQKGRLSCSCESVVDKWFLHAAFWILGMLKDINIWRSTLFKSMTNEQHETINNDFVEGEVFEFSKLCYLVDQIYTYLTWFLWTEPDPSIKLHSYIVKNKGIGRMLNKAMMCSMKALTPTHHISLQNWGEMSLACSHEHNSGQQARMKKWQIRILIYS